MNPSLSLLLDLGLRHLVRPLLWAPVVMVITFFLQLLLYRFWQSCPGLSSDEPQPPRESVGLAIVLLGILPLFAFVATSAFVVERGAARVIHERGAALADAACEVAFDAVRGRSQHGRTVWVLSDASGWRQLRIHTRLPVRSICDDVLAPLQARFDSRSRNWLALLFGVLGVVDMGVIIASWLPRPRRRPDELPPDRGFLPPAA